MTLTLLHAFLFVGRFPECDFCIVVARGYS